MNKIVGGFSFVAGLLTVFFAIIGLLAANNVVNWAWAERVGNSINSSLTQDQKLSANVSYALLITFGIVQSTVGFFTIKKAKGVASFILLAILTTNVIISIVHGTKSGLWPVPAIISLTLNSVALIGLSVSFIKK